METARIFWIGDSTVQTNRIDTWPQHGMGQALGLYLRPGVEVSNHAKNGRSTRSFIDEGLWAPVEAALGAGDLLLVQFGHNDKKVEDPTRYSTPEGYAENLKRFCDVARAKGAHPVLITPLTRRQFNEDGTLKDTHGPYAAAMRALAAKEKIPLIDLTAMSRVLVEGLGEERSRELYMMFPAGTYPNYPEGKEDTTHLRYPGAARFAGLVAKGLLDLGAPYAGVVLEGIDWKKLG